MPFAIEIVDCRLLSVSFTFSSAEHENRVHKCYRWKVPHELNFRLLKVLAKKTDPNFSIVVNFNFPLGASQHLSPAVIVVLTSKKNYWTTKFCQAAQVMIFTRWAGFSKSVWTRVYQNLHIILHNREIPLSKPSQMWHFFWSVKLAQNTAKLSLTSPTQRPSINLFSV